MTETEGESQEIISQKEEEQPETLTPDQINQQVQRLRQLDTERADLGGELYELTGKTKAEREGKTPTGQFSFDFGEEEPQLQEEELDPQEEIELIREGKIGQISLTELSGDMVRKGVVSSLEKRLNGVEEEIQQITQRPEVMEAYQQFRQDKIETIKRVREAQKLKSFIDNLNSQKAAIIRGRRPALNSSEHRDLHRLQEAAQDRITELQQDPETFEELRVRELLRYKRELEEDHFAETPSRQKYMDKILNLWLQRKPVMLTGETGTGKTEMVRRLSIKYWGADPLSEGTLVAGSSDIHEYILFGSAHGLQRQPDGSFTTNFEPARLGKAIVQGLPGIIDEFNLIDRSTRLRLKSVYNYHSGDPFSFQEDSAGRYDDCQKGFVWAATANVKSERYAERLDFDATEKRIFALSQIRIDYLPKAEMFDLCLASLIDRRGGLSLSRQDLETLIRLVDAAEFTQETFEGKQTQVFERGAGSQKKYAILKNMVLDPGNTLGVLRGWEEARERGISFSDFIDDQLLNFVNNEVYEAPDRLLMAQILIQKYGFLATKSVNDFAVPNLTGQELQNWRGTKTSKKGKL